MTSDRRTFLRLAGAVSTAAVAGVSASPPAGATAPAATLTRSALARAIGEEFVFEQQAVDEVVARLTKVEPLPGTKSPTESENRFRAVFKVASPEQSLAQLTYRVRHARMGEFVMFVSPRNERCDLVEAVFNRV